MRLHRFFMQFDPNQSYIIVREKSLLHQFRNVLRFKIGDKLIVFDGKLNEARVEIEDWRKDFIKLKIVRLYKNKCEYNFRITLYAALIKKSRFEWLLEKATEAGVFRIVPFFSERTTKISFNQQRAEAIIKEAAEQAGRGLLPGLERAREFRQAVEKQNEGLNILFDQRGRRLTSLNFAARPRRIGIWIGPEGGFSSQEINWVKKKGFFIASLGPFTLRSESAGFASILLAANLYRMQ